MIRNKARRKTPAPPEKHRSKKMLETIGAPDMVFVASWLPPTNADFIEWQKAAERAYREFRGVWHGHLDTGVDTARLLFFYTLEYAYPTEFWEGLPDLLAGKTDNLEMYIRFLEADCHFYRSGYTKSLVIRGVKRLSLTGIQKRRLQNLVTQVIDKGFRREFRDYCRLARYIQSPDWLRELETRLSASDPNRALRARWALDACRQK